MTSITEFNLIFTKINTDWSLRFKLSSEEWKTSSSSRSDLNKHFSIHFCDLWKDRCCVIVKLDWEYLFNILLFLKIWQKFSISTQQRISIIHCDPVIIFVHKWHNLIEPLPQEVSWLLTLINKPIISHQICFVDVVPNLWRHYQNLPLWT